MTLLTVPNWSFGRDQVLLRQFREILAAGEGITAHFCESDVDHNRTVTAFSGDAAIIVTTLQAMAEAAFPRIDLNRHTGVHPRIGALDVCPFVVSNPAEMPAALETASSFGEAVSDAYGLPVYLYEKSERGRHEADLPSLRKGGFGALIDKELKPDFGPDKVHPRLGVSVVGVREPLIAMNTNLETEDLSIAKTLAAQIRNLRGAGDERFLGVRALGFALASRGLTQVSLNLTLPDLASPDPIIEWIRDESLRRGVLLADTELIGVIRKRDLLGASRLPVRPEQIVD